jgi:hypothetical protein
VSPGLNRLSIRDCAIAHEVRARRWVLGRGYEEDIVDFGRFLGRYDGDLRCRHAGQGSPGGRRPQLERCYLGIEGDGRWGRSNSVAASGANVGSTLTSFDLNGGTAGCNLQIDNFVLGLQDDYSGSAKDQPPFPASTTNVLNQKWINTLRGRFGYAFDRFLVYGTAGGALAGTELVVSNPANGTLAERQSRSGWIAGVGSEWAAWSWSWVDVTFKVEYLHADFGSEAYFSPPPRTAQCCTRYTRRPSERRYRPRWREPEVQLGRLDGNCEAVTGISRAGCLPPRNCKRSSTKPRSWLAGRCRADRVVCPRKPQGRPC